MSKYNLSNIKSYLVGKWRYKLYNSHCCYGLLRTHIEEQIEFRIEHMQDECYNNGSCTLCGCETPALQMSDKACDKPCYPSMMNKKEWKLFNRGSIFWDRKLKVFWKFYIKESKLISFKNQKELQNHVERFT